MTITSLVLFSSTGLGVGGLNLERARAATTGLVATPTATVAPCPKLSAMPPVPPNGQAYLGAWVNPAHLTGKPTAGDSPELSQLPTLTGPIGRPLGILHLYASWDAPAPVAALSKLAATGAVPMLDWAKGPAANIINGSEDSTITTYATALKNYGGPVFLRYAWEMNLKPATSAPPADFISAWRHIHDIFQKVGATNVAFVWCPGVAHGNYAAYYPGSDVVDWIGIDGYDRRASGANAFAQVFGAFYQQFVDQGKPIAVAETGAMTSDQANYVQSLATVLPAQFPLIKALVYFDAIGPAGSWVLHDDGMKAFAALAKSSYFSFMAGGNACYGS